jgi:hypothetical protein
VRIFHTIQLLEILLSPRTAVPPEQLKFKGGGFQLPDFDGIDLVRERGPRNSSLSDPQASLRKKIPRLR